MFFRGSLFCRSPCFRTHQLLSHTKDFSDRPKPTNQSYERKLQSTEFTRPLFCLFRAKQLASFMERDDDASDVIEEEVGGGTGIYAGGE